MSISESVSSLSLAGKVAVITGGGTGIGKGIALEFAKAGASVAVSGRRPDVLAEAVKEIEALGVKGLAVPTDVRKKSDVENLAQRATDELGDIDVLVNNAAHGGSGPSLLGSDEDRWDEIIDTNLKSVYLCCHAIGNRMMARNTGSIINISSVAGLRPGGCRIYGVAKAGVNFLTQGLALDMGPHNVRVNAIAPGMVQTAMLEHDVGSDPGVWDSIGKYAPLQRVGQPVDLGSVTLFLASNASNYVTGQVFSVDGGLIVGDFQPDLDFSKEPTD